MADYDRLGERVLVLLSGGIDSAACTAFYLEAGFQVESLFVDYGQAAAKREADAAAAIAAHYGMPLRKLYCRGASAKPAGFVEGRNAFLVLIGLMEACQASGLIALGVHAGTEYWDCSPQFATLLQALVDAYTGGQVQVAAPFLEWTKREIWDYSNDHQVPVHLTYSCELGLSQPCGRCLSCRDLEALYASA